MSTMEQQLGEPTYALSWDELLTRGLPQPQDDQPGLYAVYADGELVYLGRSESLNRRLGQFVGAALGGWYLHSGGWSYFNARREGKVPADLRLLKLAAWVGARAYGREAELIGLCRPRLNVKDKPAAALRLPSSGLFAGGRPLGALEADGLQVLDALIRSVDREPHGGDAARWTEGDWHGVSRRVGRLWKHTLYLGWREGGPRGVEVGLWAYEDEVRWFPEHGDTEQHAQTAEELDALGGAWAAGWWRG